MNEFKTANYATKIILLSLLFIVPIALTHGQRPQAPDPPDGSKAVNLTEVIPVNYTHIIEKETPSVLMFKNLYLEVTSTTSVKLETTSNQNVPFQYLRLDLDPREAVELEISITTEPPPQSTPANDSIGVYLSIEPNSTRTGSSNLSLYINSEAIEEKKGRSINPLALNWAYWNGTEWKTVKSWLNEEGYLVTDTEHLSAWTIRETGRPSKAPDIPALPEKAETHNYTDVTPKGFTWRVKEREPTVLLFRNMTVILNTTKELPLNITVNQMVLNKIFRLDLSPGESLSLDIMVDVRPPSGVTGIEKDIGVYLDITPNATADVGANLSLLIEEDSLEAELGRSVDLSRLSWAYWDEERWVFVESAMDDYGYLNAETSHFSVWSVAETPLPTIPVPVPIPDIPGIPEDIRAYNYSETSPVDLELRLNASKPVVFAFKEFVLVVNPGKAVDIMLTVGSDVARHVFSLSLIPGESIKVDVDISGNPPSGVDKPQRDIGVYLTLEPNKTVSIDATLSLLINEEAIEAQVNRDINVSMLTWAYLEGETWIPVMSNIDEKGYLNAEISHFSTWTILEEEAVTPSPEPSPEKPSYIWFLLLGLVAVIGVILFTRRR